MWVKTRARESANADPMGTVRLSSKSKEKSSTNVPAAAPTKAIRDAVRAAGFATPIVCAGGVHNFELAEGLLSDGVCDIVGAARQSLADPDWALKISLGRGPEVRTCEFTNYCEGLDQKHKSVTCQLWDKEGLDQPGVARSRDGKRRLTAPDWPHPADAS